MREVAIRTFAGRYHRWRGPRKAFRPEALIEAVATARTLLSLLGIGISLAGLPIAWWVDRIAGMALLVVGGFLMILPLTASTDEE
jgi:hypothetical protein